MSTNCNSIKPGETKFAFVYINKLLNARVSRGNKSIHFKLDLGAYNNAGSNHKASDVYVLYHHDDGWRFRRYTECGIDKARRAYQLFRNSKRSIWRAFKTEHEAIMQFNEYIDRVEKQNAA